MWVHDTCSLKPDLLLALHFPFFLLLASTVGWTRVSKAVKPPDGTLPSSHKLVQERCARHWNSLRFRFIGIAINSVGWGGSLGTSGMQIRLCWVGFFLLKMAIRQSLEGYKKCSVLGHLCDFPYVDPEGKEIQIWIRKRKQCSESPCKACKPVLFALCQIMASKSHQGNHSSS